MIQAKYIHIACLIIYAIFQFYQACSSFMVVFIEYKSYFDLNIKLLTVFHIVGLCSSSTCLILGSIKLNVKLIASAMLYLLYKVGFFFWHLQKTYNITIGCVEDRESFCDPERLTRFYQHILLFGKKFYIFINLPDQKLFQLI